MGVANGDSERTAAGALDELLGEVRVGIVVAVHEVVGVGTVADVAELGLDVNVEDLGDLDDVLRELEVLLIGKRGAVDHDGGETGLDALDGDLVTSGVILVDGDGHARALGVIAGGEGDDVEGTVVLEAGPVLDDDRHVLILGGLDRITDGLRVDDVDRGHAIVVLGRMLKKLVDLDERHLCLPFTWITIGLDSSQLVSWLNTKRSARQAGACKTRWSLCGRLALRLWRCASTPQYVRHKSNDRSNR